MILASSVFSTVPLLSCEGWTWVQLCCSLLYTARRGWPEILVESVEAVAKSHHLNRTSCCGKQPEITEHVHRTMLSVGTASSLARSVASVVPNVLDQQLSLLSADADDPHDSCTWMPPREKQRTRLDVLRCLQQHIRGGAVSKPAFYVRTYRPARSLPPLHLADSIAD